MDCNIFNKDLLSDINWDSLSIDLKFLDGLIDKNKAVSNSGTWIPVYIYKSSNQSKYGEPLLQSSTSYVEPFNPCNCNDSQIFSIGRTYYDKNRDVDLNCTYCGNYSQEWRLYDDKGTSSEDVLGTNGVFTSDCCGGACDIKLRTDDFLPKVPVLNQVYISGFYDFKYLKQFPACSNPGLGKEAFITVTGFQSIGTNTVFCIDWKLKETISEIAYNAFDSQHINEYTHNKSFKKSEITSSTCGNFILLDFEKNMSTTGEGESETTVKSEKYQDYLDAYPIFDTMGTSQSIPIPESFNKPYGFRDGTHNNIFINGKKLASYWKWTYDYGIIAWARYNPYPLIPSGQKYIAQKDDRPINNYDLYISNGDVFFAKNMGPEPANESFINTPSTPNVSYSVGEGATQTPETSETQDYFIKPCPSGLKIVDNNNVIGIIPPNSTFLYISENIYPRFYDLYTKYINDYKASHETAVKLASTLCTAPLYDGFTTDLMDKEGFKYYSEYNEFGQISGLNVLMLQDTKYDSANNLNYISNIKEFALTLYSKYGGYIWCPPNSSTNIAFPLSTNTNSMYVDLDFDTVVNIDSVKYSKANSLPYKTCPSNVNALNIKKYYYDQQFQFGNLKVSSKIDNNFRSKQVCSGDKISKSDFVLYAGVALNDNVFNSMPIFSGAYSFLDIYRRIVNPDNILSYCSDCGEESSFYLAADSSGLCNNAEDDSKTFCYATESFRLNNNEKPEGKRPLRNISNNTEYFYRGYPAIAYNPHIDLVAFHQNGGAFFNASVFNENIAFDKNIINTQGNSISINFTTKDVGIKLYSITAAKLQSNEKGTEQCQRFPIDFNKSCKCYGLNINQYNEHPKICNKPNTSYGFSSLYTPNLSTRYSPSLQFYGGFSSYEISTIFELNNLPHIGKFLPIVFEKKDPENPYGCEKSSTITLGNYTTTNYKVNLVNYDNTNSDIVASVDEPIDLTGSPNNQEFDEDTGETNYSTNIYWKRFLNKVKISSTTLYNQQERIITPKGASLENPYEVTLTNPFLNALLGNSNASLPFPTADPCAAVNNNIIINDVRGDETSYVNLTISQKPRKQLLTFSFGARISTSGVAGSGTNNKKLKNGSFHPNLGLFNNYSNGGKVIDEEGNILYGINNANLDNQSFGQIKQNVVFDQITRRISDSLEKISKLSINKKPKFYVKTSENLWRSFYNPSKKGYRLDDTDFIGKSMLFEYALNHRSAFKIPGLIPAIPRYPAKFNYLIRANSILEQNSWSKNFPVAINNDFEFDVATPQKLRVPGARDYFRVPELIQIITLAAWRSFDIADFIAHFDPANILINSQKIDDKKTFDFPVGYIVQTVIGYYTFTGGDPATESSYVFIGNNPNINRLTSNLDIDYSNYAKTGYVYTTNRQCYHKVMIQQRTSKQGEVSLIPNAIIEKRIMLKFFDRFGNQLNYHNFDQSEKYIKVYTEFVFENKIKDMVGLDWSNSTLSVIAYLNTQYLQQEKDRILNNDLYQTKWGDLIKYDGSLFLNPHIINHTNNYGPSTPYKNSFFKQIFNQGNNDFLFGFQKHIDGPTEYQYLLKKSPNLNILQKYSIDDKDIWSLDTMKYENYLPFLEISDNFPRENIPNNGYLSSPMFVVPYESLSDLYKQSKNSNNLLSPRDGYFFATTDYLESAFVPEGRFFNETLRLDIPLFWLDKTIKENAYRRPSDAKNLFIPSNTKTFTNTNTENVNLIKNFKVVGNIKRQTPYYRKNVYADIDTSGNCQPEKCSMRTAGYVNLYSQFKQAEPQLYNVSQVDYVDYFIGYDAGLYNPLGDSRYISIIRTELDLNNPIQEQITCDTTTPKPVVNQPLLSSYQNYILNKSSEHENRLIEAIAKPSKANNVAIMDNHANEMLFRIFYGEKQKVNRKQLYVDNKNLTLEDLISYTDPVIKPKHLYDEILYNYDQSTSTNINFEGTLNIHGTQKIGDSINIQIANVNINLTIYKVDEDIYLGGNIGNQRINSLIYQSKYVATTLLVTDHITTNTEPPPYLGEYGEENRTIDNQPPEDPSPTSDNQTITFLTQQSFTSPSVVRVVTDLKEGVDPDSLTSGRGENYTAVGADLAISYRTVEEKIICHPPSKPFDPFTFGYCSINEDGTGCDSCDNFDGIEGGTGDSPNFEYEFEMCSTKFKLMGHAYRKKYIDPNADPNSDEDNAGDVSVQNLIDYKPIPTPSYRDNIFTINNTIDPSTTSSTDPLVTSGPVIPSTTSGNPDTTNSPNTPNVSNGGGETDCSTIHAIGRGCWVESCYSYWGSPYECSIVVEPGRSTLTRKVFKSSTVTKLDPYKPPTCPIPFITITYNNKTLTVSFPNNRAISTDEGFSQGSDSGQICVDLKVNKGCPDIRVNHIPEEYLLYESINSSCVDCQNNTDLLLNDQELSYDYYDYSAVCEVGKMIYGDIDGSPVVQVGFRASDGTDDFGRSLPPCYGNVGSLVALCGGGLPWRACQNPTVLKSGSNVQNATGTNSGDDPTFVECDPPKFASQNFRYGSAESYVVWKENIQKQFDKAFLNGQIGNSYSGPLHDSQVIPAIPTSDIIEGVIPGSASLNFEEQQITLTKIRPVQGGGIETGEFIANIVVAYIKYTYRAGKTIGLSLISNAKTKSMENSDSSNQTPSDEELFDQLNQVVPEYDESGVLIGVKTANGLQNCKFLEFPDSYKATSNSGNLLPLNPTYVLTKTLLSKKACNSNISCYDKYTNKQTICNANDWVCWSYAHFATRRAFLNRLYSASGENWT